MSRLERLALLAAVFLAGALLMALEVAAFRIIGRSFGSALRETTTVIAVFLAAMSVGYWGGGVAGDRRPLPSTLVVVLLFAAALLSFVPLVDAALTPWIAQSRLTLAAHAFVATAALFAIPTLLLAATSPIAIRLFTTTTGHSGTTAGTVSAISTAGSIAGSLFTAFFLIDWLRSINRTVLFVATGCCIAAAMVALASLSRARPDTRAARRLVFAAGMLLLVVIPAAAFIRSTRIDQSLLASSSNTKILYVGESPYHRITVRERHGRYRDLLFDLSQQTTMRLDDPSGHGFAYTDAMHVPKLLRPSIRNVLIIGLGGGTVAKQYLRFYPDAQIDVVEIDPLVVEVARKYFAVTFGPRLRLHLMDGRVFVARETRKWDLVILDAFNTNRYGASLPPHLVTREFFGQLEEHLTPGGIVYFHAGFEVDAFRRSVHKTLASVFLYVGRIDNEFLASDAPLQTSKSVMHERARQYGGTLPAIPGQIEALTLAVPQTDDVPLLTDDFAPVDTLLGRK